MSMSENAVQQRGRNLAAYYGPNWRNNSGACYDDTGRLIRYGLGNDSAQMNKRFKSPDTVGIRTVLVEPYMVGWTLGVFTGIEFKHEGWVRNPNDDHENAQQAFMDLIIQAGGWAGFAASDEDVKRILRVAP